MHLSLSGEVRYVLNQPALPQVGTYELLHWVGSGGLASVFLARNATKPAQTARDLVLKLLKNAAPEAQQAFDSECTFLSEMDDPFIVPYVDHDEDPEYGKYIVLHYIEGSTLETILRARQTIPVAELVAIALQVCYALRAIHRKGKVHCDIKPENILIGLDGQVKVIDLGAVTSFEDQPGYASTLYQPPEFAEQPPGRVTARSDIYSLGLVMFEMLYGKYILNPNNALSEHARSLQQQRAVLVRDMTIVTLPMVEQATHGQKKLEMPENNKLSPIIERCLRMQDEYLSIQPLIDHLEKVQREFDTNPNIAWLHEKDG
jgi:serine/threonine-protein kinase